LKIHLRQIPVEGSHLEGEEDCFLPQLTSEEARCAGPLRYSLDAGISEGALWVKGDLAQPVELRCVRCLEPFPFEIKVKDFAVHVELTGPEEVDLTPFLREDILLNLPAYPHCDREGGRICPLPASHREDVSEGGSKRPTDWSALDQLKL
jgi:uncharacterized metal-binding protein YceD (DUF177 family)